VWSKWNGPWWLDLRVTIKYIWIHWPPYHIISILYRVHILSYSYSTRGAFTVSYSYVFEYIQKLIFRIVFLASTTCGSSPSLSHCIKPAIHLYRYIFITSIHQSAEYALCLIRSL
jgi:hypothetical protein